MTKVFIVTITSLLIACSGKMNDQLETHSTEMRKFMLQTIQKRYPLMTSNDHGMSWSDASSNLPKNLQASFIEQKGDELLLASDNEGIFISTNNKSSWSQIGRALPNKKINALHVSDHKIYVGVYRSGIFETIDNGKTWMSLNKNLPNKSVQAILSYQNQLIIGTDAGIFLFDLANEKWIPTNIKTQTLSIYSHNNILVAGTILGTAISKDSGYSWEWVRKDGAVHYTHPLQNQPGQTGNKTMVELALNGDLVFSKDNGKTWQKIAYKLKGASYIYEIIRSDKYILFSNNYGIHRSQDEGTTWKLVYPTESMAFFDLLEIEGTVYGITREWDEFRGKEQK